MRHDAAPPTAPTASPALTASEKAGDIGLPWQRRLTPPRRLALLAVLALACALLFMTVGVKTDWAFALQFRGKKLLAMLLVAYAIGVSTVLFQTITHNRILTPAIMGFDALYLLIQTLLAFLFGMRAVNAFDPTLKFLSETLLMVLLAWLLFRSLFSGAVRSLHLMLLVGVVMGVLFRSLTSLLLRLIDPNEFGSLQDRFFASFNLVATHLIVAAAVVLAATSWWLWRLRHNFDVIGLGRDMAINLGVDYPRVVMQILVCIAIMVSVSTALVGPVTFFGLLVANLAYQLMGDSRHRNTLPAAVLLGVVALLGGQLLLERVFEFNTALSVVIEFVGGLVFIALLLGGKGR
ncbi:enterobactin ABC transporter permease [Corticibacter populi]|uniref:Enterobactin ABC transporter permease n=1 Tax=Corticibacter populi TaxID=1550736 RepID=A0A3M6QYJ4_9BURK|nr:iron chelate uptake ABC transporter family permease subunit [Corticibacter populi]RMX08068.1 enterobactin ABC transporter permease [Corticibacter populi]RZS35315.1 iron complex transport system permease protein [Corticibacter populi]